VKGLEKKKTKFKGEDEKAPWEGRRGRSNMKVGVFARERNCQGVSETH